MIEKNEAKNQPEIQRGNSGFQNSQLVVGVHIQVCCGKIKSRGSFPEFYHSNTTVDQRIDFST